MCLCIKDILLSGAAIAATFLAVNSQGKSLPSGVVSLEFINHKESIMKTLLASTMAVGYWVSTKAIEAANEAVARVAPHHEALAQIMQQGGM